MSYKFIKIIKVQRLSLVFFCEFKSIYTYIYFISKTSSYITIVTEGSSLDFRLLTQELGKQNRTDISHISHLRQLFHYSRKEEHSRTNCQSMSSIWVFFKIKNLAITNEYISHLLKCSHTDQDKEVLQCSETINVYIN